MATPSLPLEFLGSLPDAHGHPLVEFHHSPTHQLLYVQWFGNLTGREIIRVARDGLGLHARLRYPLLLNDKSQATGDWSEAMDWLEYEWLPQAMDTGLRAIAYVFSPEVHNQLVSVDFFERVRQQLPIQLFHKLPAAWEWLAQEHHSPDPAVPSLP
ncbi:hypothetical protein [Hymenobacter sublimis]|uniref:STAS/SEC14 domain-containing protein n=1 Tax=Hymenobacter sublimis TaxID=2933777 RepID=A0ABY4JDV5_9BACT|nr:hypothetical protein [Hymenobacter sublimis]UPL49967.1 hypothetical protein MWH26_03425 [Hymenobacter sublimis]